MSNDDVGDVVGCVMGWGSVGEALGRVERGMRESPLADPSP